VRGLLLEHPEGLTTGQIRDLLGPEQAGNRVSTVVTKMRLRGLLEATGERGFSVYKLVDRHGDGAEEHASDETAPDGDE
jgi:hypothetical protein